MDADGQRRLTVDASGQPDRPPRSCAPLSTEQPVPGRDGQGLEDAGCHPHGLHPHPVPAFIAFVFARLIEARGPDAAN